MATATFAAGCFWGVEQRFAGLPGVTSTEVGYTGGTTSHPTYEQVCSHTTGHAEAVRLEYDPERISYEELLAAFFGMHDPTQLNRQGPDVGDQYRSAVFFHTPEQETAARARSSSSRRAPSSSGRSSRRSRPLPSGGAPRSTIRSTSRSTPASAATSDRTSWRGPPASGRRRAASARSPSARPSARRRGGAWRRRAVTPRLQVVQEEEAGDGEEHGRRPPRQRLRDQVLDEADGSWSRR